MKLSRVYDSNLKQTQANRTNYNNSKNQNNDTRNKNSNNNVQFTGLMQGLGTFWDTVAQSRALSFTLEDMCGTNVPRTIKGAFSGYDKTHKINWLGVAQEGIREFLTGPTMCFMPLGILAAAKKMGGNSTEIKFDNIKQFSHLMKDVESDKTVKQFGDELIQKTVEDILTQTIGPDCAKDSQVLEKLTGHFKEIHRVKTQNSPESKEKLKELYGNLQSDYEKIFKQHAESYKNTDFRTVNFSVGAKKGTQEIMKGSAAITDVAGYASDFITDFGKKYSDNNGTIKNISNKIGDFSKQLLGKRGVAAAAMIGITAFAMTFIPKLYTMASGKVNPLATDVYDEAENKTGKKNNIPQKADKKEEKPINKKFVALAATSALAAGAYIFGKHTSKGEKLVQQLSSSAKEVIENSKLANTAKETTKKIASPIINKVGQFLDSNLKKDGFRKVANLFEPKHWDLPFMTQLGLMVGVVIAPRVATAKQRNAGDVEKANDEVKEILFRDIQTVAILLYALGTVNALIGGIVGKKTGLPINSQGLKKLVDKTGSKHYLDALAKKPTQALKNLGSNALQVIKNPFSGGTRLLGSSEISQKYGNLDGIEQVKKMFNEIDANNGNKEKVFKKTISYIIDETKDSIQKHANALKDAGFEVFDKSGNLTEAVTKQDTEATKAICRLQEKLQALQGVKESGEVFDCSEPNKIVVDALTDFFKGDNKLSQNAKTTGTLLKTAWFAGEVGYLGFGLPALNRRRIEKKYLKNEGRNVNMQASIQKPQTINSLQENTAPVKASLKPNEIKLYSNFLADKKQ